MGKPFVLPERPLERFKEIYDALNRRRMWYHQVTPIRFSALTLATTHVDPNSLSGQLFALSDDLKKHAGWLSGLNSDLRFVVVAVLMRNGDGVEPFLREVDRVRAIFRERKMRRGGGYEAIAVLIMRERDPDGTIRERTIDRFKEIYEMMNAYHWWLTGPDDYPACAVLAGQNAPVAEMGVRMETFYNGLVKQGFSRGGQLQLVSHMLTLNPAPERTVLDRYASLYQGFKRRGLWMNAGDYDEVALLSILDRRSDEIIDRVAEHRTVIEAFKPKPGPNMSFSLACSTAFLELVRFTEDVRAVTDVKALANMQALIVAQHSAAAAGAS